MTAKNLWGELPTQTPVRTPLAIVREQAALLSELTKNILEGEVTAGHTPEGLLMKLDIVAPALDGARHTVLTVTYEKDQYPLLVSGEEVPAHSCDNEESFVASLEQILSSVRVKKIIQDWTTQSQARV